MKADDKILTNGFRLLEHQYVSRVAKVEGSHGNADFLSISHVGKQYTMLARQEKTLYAKIAPMRALLASYEKDEALLRLARPLSNNTWSLLGSSGTAKYLNENGIKCRDVAETVGKP